VKWAWEQPDRSEDWEWATSVGATASGQLEVLKWAREQGCPWDWRICRHAVEDGNLDILQWAREHGCPWYAQELTRCAAKHGQLEVMKWLWEQGVPWSGYTCAEAAEGGHLKLLKWLREHHCPWDHNTYRWAGASVRPEKRQRTRQKIQTWALANGCDPDDGRHLRCIGCSSNECTTQ
jgi:hypothetical protein